MSSPGDLLVYSNSGRSIVFQVIHLYEECWEIKLTEQPSRFFEGTKVIRIQDNANLSYEDGSRPATPDPRTVVFHPTHGYFAIVNDCLTTVDDKIEHLGWFDLGSVDVRRPKRSD